MNDSNALSVLKVISSLERKFFIFTADNSNTDDDKEGLDKSEDDDEDEEEMDLSVDDVSGNGLNEETPKQKKSKLRKCDWISVSENIGQA